MSDTPEKKPTTRFGSMKEQFETIGGATDMQGTLTQEHQDAKTSAHSQEDMKRQTVYMPQRLATRLKVHAAIIGDDISGIITRLVKTYLDEVEKDK
jgi:hypothetical protein